MHYQKGPESFLPGPFVIGLRFQSKTQNSSILSVKFVACTIKTKSFI